MDTEALVNCETKAKSSFPLAHTGHPSPLLITVSQGDAMLANDMASECRDLHSKSPNIQYRLFDWGEHPLILSRAEEMADAIKAFFLE